MSTEAIASIAQACGRLSPDTLFAFGELRDLLNAPEAAELHWLAEIMDRVDQLTLRESKILYQGFFHEYTVTEKAEHEKTYANIENRADLQRVLAEIQSEYRAFTADSSRAIRKYGVPTMNRVADAMMHAPDSNTRRIGGTLKQLLLELRHGRGVYHTVDVDSLDGH